MTVMHLADFYLQAEVGIRDHCVTGVQTCALPISRRSSSRRAQISAVGVRRMSTPGTAAPGSGALELPPFSLDVQALDLGGEVKPVGLELIETQNREPVRGKDAAEIWSAVFPALAGDESYAVDFFSHIERVREFCKMREIRLREAAERCVVLPQPNREQLRLIFERFEAETFGLRAGAASQSADAVLEGELSRRGL